jgi:hypothetical protein
MDLDQELHPHGAGEAAERFPGRGVVTPLQAGHHRLGNPESLRERGLGKPMFGPVLDDLDGDRSRQGTTAGEYRRREGQLELSKDLVCEPPDAASPR